MSPSLAFWDQQRAGVDESLGHIVTTIQEASGDSTRLFLALYDEMLCSDERKVAALLACAVMALVERAPPP